MHSANPPGSGWTMDESPVTGNSSRMPCQANGVSHAADGRGQNSMAVEDVMGSPSPDSPRSTLVWELRGRRRNALTPLLILPPEVLRCHASVLRNSSHEAAPDNPPVWSLATQRLLTAAVWFLAPCSFLSPSRPDLGRVYEPPSDGFISPGFTLQPTCVCTLSPFYRSSLPRAPPTRSALLHPMPLRPSP